MRSICVITAFGIWYECGIYPAEPPTSCDKAQKFGRNLHIGQYFAQSLHSCDMERRANDLRTMRHHEISLTLVWVERTVDSTAAGAHLRGTRARLGDDRFRVRVFTQEGDGPAWLPGAARKAWRILSVVGRARLSRPGDVLLARWSPFIALISRRWQRRGRPTVLFVQGNLDDLYDSNPWTRRVPWITRVALESIRDATRIVTPSEGLAQWVATVRPDGRDSVTVLPNGVDVELFDRAREAAAAEPAEPHALFFGNMAPWQGIDTVLAALSDPAWPRDLGLHFIGDGHLAEAVRTCGDPRVRYLGRQPKAEVARAAARAEITLATRHADAASATGVSPFKIIESAAAGTPCVVTRVPGQTELAEDIGGSIVIPSDDPAALAQAVARLHADPELRARLAATGTQSAKRYDWAAGSQVLTGVALAAAGLDAADPDAVDPDAARDGTRP